MKRLILIRGLPGSGKSTLAKKILSENPDKYVHFENDMFLYENGKYIWTKDRYKKATRACFTNTIDALNKGLNIIVSNCFLTKKSLHKYASLVPLEDLLIIEAKGNYISIHEVSETLMNRMKTIYEPN